MAEEKNYYTILGVEEKATADEITKVYRELALKYHPDRNKTPEAVSIFQEIVEAYACLCDPEKRKQYDKDLDGINLKSNYSTGFNHSHNSNDIFNRFFNHPNFRSEFIIPGNLFFAEDPFWDLLNILNSFGGTNSKFYQYPHSSYWSSHNQTKFNQNNVDTNIDLRLHTVLSEVSPNLKLVEILIKAGANVNEKNTYGDTALNQVLSKSSPDKELVKMLIELGADVNGKDIYGDTALNQDQTKNW